MVDVLGNDLHRDRFYPHIKEVVQALPSARSCCSRGALAGGGSILSKGKGKREQDSIRTTNEQAMIRDLDHME